jgi:hypothetical protein
VNGTSVVDRAGTVTLLLAGSAQAPTSVDGWPNESRSYPPLEVLNASAAYTRRVSGMSLTLLTATKSLITVPGAEL